MQTPHGAPLHLIFMVFALVLFALAAFGWPQPIEPYRMKLVAGGLFFWCLSFFF